MVGFLWILTEVIALVVFVGALMKGRSFWSAVKMGVGVLILGLVAILALGLLFGLLKITMALLGMVLWVVIIYAVIVLVARLIRGAA